MIDTYLSSSATTGDTILPAHSALVTLASNVIPAFSKLVFASILGWVWSLAVVIALSHAALDMMEVVAEAGA